MKHVANLVAALMVLLAAQTAAAQSSYPNRPVKMLVGFTPRQHGTEAQSSIAGTGHGRTIQPTVNAFPASMETNFAMAEARATEGAM